jgi:hypothetical protein
MKKEAKQQHSHSTKREKQVNSVYKRYILNRSEEKINKYS